MCRPIAASKFWIVLLVLVELACDSKRRGYGKDPADGAASSGRQADSSSELADAEGPSPAETSDTADADIAATGAPDADVAATGAPDSDAAPDAHLDASIAADAAAPSDVGSALASSMPTALGSTSAEATSPTDIEDASGAHDSSDASDAGDAFEIPDPCSVGSIRACAGCGLETCESGHWSDCIVQQAPTCESPATALTCGAGNEWQIEACGAPSECFSGTCLNVFHGDAVLAAASDVATYSEYDVIDGNLHIDIPAELGAGVALPRLKVVRGNVTLVYNGVEHATNVIETRCGVSEEAVSYIAPLDLTSLETVEGSLTLRQAGHFRYPFTGGFGTAYVDFGLAALNVLGGDLSLSLELAGSKACGLPALPSAPGNVTIDYGRHEMFAGGDPLLPVLTEIAGVLEIKGATFGVSCPDVLPLLGYAGGLSLTNEGFSGSGLASFPLASLTDVAGLALFEGSSTQDSARALLRVGHLQLKGPPDVERIGGATLELGGLTMEGGSFVQPTEPKLTLTPLATVELSDMWPVATEDACAFIAYHRARGWQEDVVIDGLPVSCP